MVYQQQVTLIRRTSALIHNCQIAPNRLKLLEPDQSHVESQVTAPFIDFVGVTWRHVV